MKFKTKKILYLPIETTARELDSKILLAHRALSRGYIVIIGKKKNVKGAAEKIGFGTFLHKDHVCKSFPRNGRGANFNYVALDEEGGVFLSEKEYIERAMPKRINYLDLIFTWGKYQKKLLIKENPELNKKSIATGNPRFDLLYAKFFPLYESTKKKLHNKHNNYILINTNFGPGNFSRYYGCTVLEHREKASIRFRGRSLYKHERDFIKKRGEYYRKLFIQYQGVIKRLSIRFPELTFILRPHPSEDHGNWRKAFKGLSNVKVIYKGNVIDWIQGAIAVIHNDCTTGIEAWALNKPVFRFNPNPKPEYEARLPVKLGYSFSSAGELKTAINKVLNREMGGTFNKQISIIKPFIESIQGKYSSERIIEELEKLPTKQSGKNKPPLSFNGLRDIAYSPEEIKFFLFRVLVKYIDFFTLFTGQERMANIYSRIQKFSGIRKKYIQKRLKQLDKIFKESYKHDYQIRKISADTYLIKDK